MANQLLPFQFEGQSIRVLQDKDGDPWFNVVDVCAVLAFGNSRQALESHVDSEDVQKLDTPTGGGIQQQNHVNESGLYALIFGSKKEESKRFKRWVTHEILPTLRKTGSYGPATPPAPQVDPVRDLLQIRQAMCSVQGVSDALAMAVTLDAIERATGLPTTMLARALPAVAPADAATLNPTQVGESLGLSGRGANTLLEEMGLQCRDENKNWILTDAGITYGEMKPFHKNGHSGYEVRWKPGVVEVVRRHLQQPA